MKILEWRPWGKKDEQKTAGPTSPEPDSREALQRRADELQRTLNTFKQGQEMANANPVGVGGHSADREPIESVTATITELKRKGVEPSIEQFQSKAAYNVTPSPDDLNRATQGQRMSTETSGSTTKSNQDLADEVNVLTGENTAAPAVSSVEDEKAA